jgi:hypothetical protein
VKRTTYRAAGAVIVIGAVIGSAAPAYASSITQTAADNSAFFGGFTGVAAVSATDGWAVGGNGNGMIQRYNGVGWVAVASPDLLAGGTNTWAGLAGVDMLSASSAFAVGRTSAASDDSAAVAERWNGTQWSRLTVPRAAGTDTSFTGVKAFSASDAWAVGEGGTWSHRLTLAMHWNGSQWTAVPTPSPGTRNNWVTAVDGTGPADVWAVGYTLDLPYGNRFRQSLVMHYDGGTWTQVPSPNNGSTYLYDVAALTAGDAWAVGYGSDGGAFVLRWNGTAWSSAPAPPGLSSLTSVAARSDSDVWVTGGDANGAPALGHFNGSTWTVTPVTVTGGVGLPYLCAITKAGPSAEFAVGYQADGTTGQSGNIAFRIAG